MFSKTTALTLTVLLATGALASPVDNTAAAGEKRQSCPGVHVFGARETTASPGYGTAASVVSAIVAAHSGATSEAISYPACGGQASCGGISYADSVSQGTSAVVTAVSNYAKQCPSTELVLVGYSQGAEIFDAALCGATGSGGSIASYNIKAAIFMGDPRFKAGAPYNVGTCTAGGFDQRSGSCGNYNAQIQSYCDSADPYCCNGNNAAVHQGYASEYGSQAESFVNSKL
ncbi:family 5 carbohydrate esterase [Cryphonectria parasitica EP155]|uniref:Family 5 carbohydrate esterase n=1 Tax=Cryphonectria parasitica (strain ATCC 38755 / EP155) TaxID=660469 RepID=A0A9P5CLP6_CRYP1|nr:family 5 carbohydrate esterase [Cryphonectria parasitica EP155]KAF3762050.1 family 5 carbohydrate esterase [Cryphonectria parasitica EP155]